MRRRPATLALLTGVIAAAGVASTAGGAAAGVHSDRFIPASSSAAHGDTESSLNWSGYVSDPGSGVTGVESTFTVPTAGLLPPGFSANWAGIGGFSGDDLIQAGTSENFSDNPVTGPQYYAWYEILPASETQLTGCSGDSACTVSPGDKVTVDIHTVGTNLWSVSLTDAGHWTFQKTITYTSSESSAEWIYEAPTVGVQTIPDNTGTNHFGPTNTFTNASGTHSIAAGNPITLDMGPGLVNEATPSALASNGESFDVCTYAQNCPTPTG